MNSMKTHALKNLVSLAQKISNKGIDIFVFDRDINKSLNCKDINNPENVRVYCYATFSKNDKLAINGSMDKNKPNFYFIDMPSHELREIDVCQCSRAPLVREISKNL